MFHSCNNVNKISKINFVTVTTTVQRSQVFFNSLRFKYISNKKSFLTLLKDYDEKGSDLFNFFKIGASKDAENPTKSINVNDQRKFECSEM